MIRRRHGLSGRASWLWLWFSMTPGFVQPLPASEVRLITLDPGHFHASLVQMFMYPEVSAFVHVYAPEGPDLREYLARINQFNSRPSHPTRWEERVHTGPDFLEQMTRDHAGNVVVISGNNSRKTEYIARAVDAGFHVLADKPMAITPAGFDQLRLALETATSKNVLVWDIMTERHEITAQVQRELARLPDLFGTLEKGSPQQPSIVMESVHYFLKEVAGKPLQRPPWFFDVRQEGEAIADVGTHLVDLVQWLCFPDQALDWRQDIKVFSARRWSTRVTREQFQRVTGLAQFPDYLREAARGDDALSVCQNGETDYTIRGVHARVSALWKCEPPAGAQDAHYALLRGTKASLMVRQNPRQHNAPTLYVFDNSGGSSADFETRLRKALAKLNSAWPGLALRREGESWAVVVPEKYNVGHEAHFAQVTQDFLRFLAQGKLPAWETPNLLAKYRITTEAYRLSHAGPESPEAAAASKP